MTVSRTVNVSSWPPVITTESGPTLTLDQQKSIHNDKWYRLTDIEEEKKNNKTPPNTDPWWAGWARKPPTPHCLARPPPLYWNIRFEVVLISIFNFHIKLVILMFDYLHHTCLVQKQKAVKPFLIFWSFSHLFGAKTPPRSKSLSSITTLLWNCLGFGNSQILFRVDCSSCHNEHTTQRIVI